MAHRPPDLPLWLFISLALGLPLAAAAWLHPTWGHQGDMAFFFEWFQAVKTMDAFYAEGPGINYPLLGVALICGPPWLLETLTGNALTLAQFITLHKLCLGLAEGALLCVAAPVARTLAIARPRLFALALGLLPATWAGGAWFGQIDVWNTLFLLASFWGFARVAQTRSHPRLPWLGLGLLGAYAAVWTKQLVVFSLPGLVILAALGLWSLRRTPAGRWGLIGAIASTVLLIAPDVWAHLPSGYVSSLQWVWLGGGSSHSDVLSGNGANLWALVSSDPGQSSRTPWVLGLSARTLGLLATATVYAGALTWLFITRHTTPIRRVALFIGVGNLAMATLMTGVHERYLVHGVPFLLLGLAGAAPAAHRWLAPVAWFVGGFTGLFVLSSIHWDLFQHPALILFSSHTVTGLLQLGLLLLLGVAMLIESITTVRATRLYAPSTPASPDSSSPTSPTRTCPESTPHTSS